MVELCLERSYVDSAVPSQPETRAHSLPLPWWGRTLFAAIGFILVAGTTEVIRVESRLSALEAKVEDIDRSLDRVNQRLDALPQRMAEEFFSQSVTSARSKDFVQAAGALEAGSASVRLATRERVNAPPEFFARAINNLDRIAPLAVGPNVMAVAIHRARVALAEYRSSLQAAPKPRGSRRSIDNPLSPLDLMAMRGSGIIWAGPPGRDMIKGIKEVRDLFLEGGWQTLDGIEWNDVSFINMHIKYSGGALILKHVLFINCIFDTVPGNPQVAKFLDYAALGESSTKIVAATGGRNRLAWVARPRGG